MKDQIEGTANEKIGEAKSAIGQHTGDDKLAAEGEAQQAEGGVQKFAGDVKDRVSDAVDSVKNAIHDKTK